MHMELWRGRTVIEPARGDGQAGCLVGPVLGEGIAAAFATNLVGDDGGGSLIARRGKWFVEGVGYQDTTSSAAPPEV
jgi:hypothetical protein